MYPKEDPGSYSDEVDLLHGAMATLQADEIHVLRLAYFGGLTLREISVQLSQPLGTIKARVRRSLLKLRTSLSGILHQPCQPGGALPPADFIWFRECAAE